MKNEFMTAFNENMAKANRLFESKAYRRIIAILDRGRSWGYLSGRDYRNTINILWKVATHPVAKIAILDYFPQDRYDIRPEEIEIRDINADNALMFSYFLYFGNFLASEHFIERFSDNLLDKLEVAGPQVRVCVISTVRTDEWYSELPQSIQFFLKELSDAIVLLTTKGAGNGQRYMNHPDDKLDKYL